MAKTLFTASLSRHVRKVQFSFTRIVLKLLNRKPSPGYSNSPLSRLPYEIRIIIYSYLEPGLLIAPRSSYLGFFLSCRQAKNEIEELGRARLNAICTKIRNVTGVEITIKYSSGNPRSIVVIIPYTAFDKDAADPSKSARWKWKRDILISLHPLFAHPFDLIQLHLSSENAPASSVPAHDTPLKRAQVESRMRTHIRAVAFVIMYTNYYIKEDGPNTLPHKHDNLEDNFLHSPGRAVPPYPTTEVKAKRICVSWDFRTAFTSDKTQLNGTSHHSLPIWTVCRRVQNHWPRPSFYRAIARRVKERKEMKLDPLDPPKSSLATCYQLQDEERLAGEIGIVSPLRWPVQFWGGPSVTDLVDTQESQEVYISSRGLGKKVRKGLKGVTVEQYEGRRNRS